ncbi:MAG: tetratricopeptide repeat protein [Sedimentisphaerales bacterium]|nr:tetratricopeptide repeat protein [Sedimentisphaerales bacterium]
MFRISDCEFGISAVAAALAFRRHGQGVQREGRPDKPRKKWYERTSVTLCVAAGLVVIGVGFIHVVLGVTSSYQLPFDIVLKDSFGYRETLVNAERIQALPYAAALHKYPLGVRVLQKRGYMPAGREFEARTAADQREKMQQWQAEFQEALGRPDPRWQDQLRLAGQVPPGDPEDAQAYNHRGVALARQGEYQAALAEFARAIRRAPTSVDAFYNRALVCLAIGNLGAAASDLGKVIEIRPDFVEGYIRCARLHAAMNQHEQAISCLTKAIEIDPHCVRAYFERSLVHYARGDYSRAWDDVRQTQNLGTRVPRDFVEALLAASGRQ